MNLLSLFSGIGGIDLSAAWAGMRTVAFVEIDPFCRAVLAKHWPGVPCFEDVKNVTADSLSGLGPIDVIAGGFPCQDVSVAGKRAGLAGERSPLWSEFARLIREVRPRYVLAENVPGLLSVDSGEFFAGILRDLAALGYDAAWGVWGACDVGAAHRRERVFIVAYRASQRMRSGDRDAGSLCEWFGMDRSGQGGNTDDGSQGMADAALRGCGERGGAPGRAGHADERDAGMADASRAGREERDAAAVAAGPGHRAGGGDAGELGDATVIRCERSEPIRGSIGESEGEGRLLQPSGTSDGFAQPGVGGLLDGLSPGLVRGGVFAHPQVARPGEEQFPHEPPRTASGIKHCARQLKAYGNAVDPYQVCPLLAAIVEAERAGRDTTGKGDEEATT